MCLRILILFMSMLACVSSYAEADRFADPAAVNKLPVSGVSSVGYVTMALAIVLAMIYGAAWVLRKLKNFNGVTQSSITVVEAVSVGAKERVVLVRVKNRQVLVGVAPGQVSMLADMGVADESPTAPVTADASAQMPTFKQLLKKSMGLS